MVDIISIFGLIATIASSIGFLPQVIKAWKTKKTRDISMLMIAIFTISATSWIIYGLPKNDVFIVGSNVFILTLTLILLVLKVKYRGK
jgi:MtN3 and saliva related transmembrane protein